MLISHSHDDSFNYEKDQMRQIRDYISSMCSDKRPEIDIYCKTLIQSYIVFSLWSFMNDNAENTFDKWTNRIKNTFDSYLEDFY